MSSESSTPRSDVAAPLGRFVPPIWYGVLVAILGGLNIWARAADQLDHAIANVIGMVSVAIAVVVLLIWFALFSENSPRVRWAPLGIMVGAIALTAASLRIDHWTAELIPVFAWRLSPLSDRTIPQPTAADRHVPLDVTTDDDFPQFLGPDRNLGIDRIALARDWTTPPRRLWKHAIGAGHSAFSAVNGYAVTMEQRGDEELVTCYDLHTGALEWWNAIKARHATSFGGIGPRSTPAIHAGKVYAMGATGILRCLDGTNGALVWSKDLLQETGVSAAEEARQIAWGRAGSPLIVGNLVVVPGGGPKAVPVDPLVPISPTAAPPPGPISLIAFDCETGRKVWQGGDHQISYSSPSLTRIAGVRQIVSVNEDNVTGHNAATGAVLWSYPWPGSSSMNASASQAVAVGDDRLFISKGYTGGSAVFQVQHDPESGVWTTRTVWHQRRNLQTKMTNVVVYKGFVYGLSDGVLECVELATGKRRWKAGHYGHGQILRVRDLLLVVTDDGEVLLVALDPGRLHELGSFQAVDGQTWNNLCLYGPYLLVRNSREAACYELPLAGTRGPASHSLPTH